MLTPGLSAGTVSVPYRRLWRSPQIIRFMVGTATAEALHPTRVNLEQVLVGAGSAIANLRSLVAQVAPKMASVLLQGESGTGKEVVARAIHDCSTRSKAPLLPLTVVLFPPNFLKVNFLATKKAHLPAPLPLARVVLSWLRAVRCF